MTMTGLFAGLSVLFLLVLLQILIVLACEFQRPARAAAWTLLQLPLPLLGLALYWGLGGRFRSAGRPERPPLGAAGGGAGEGDRLAAALHALPPVSSEKTRVRLFSRVDETYERIIEDLREASETADFLLYTLRDDRIGTVFRQLLEEKARQGVKVRLLLDGAGSHALGGAYRDRLREAGIELVFHHPLGASFLKRKANFRNHRKLFLFDNRIAYVGGLNIGDEYLGGDPHLGFWRDSTVRLEAAELTGLSRLFERDWRMAQGQPPPPDAALSAAESAQAAAVRFALSGPDEPLSGLYGLYFTALASARRRIYLASPYWMPDEAMRMALETAVSAGVDVRILLPEIADHKLVHDAGLSFARDMAGSGVRFYLYRKGFLHDKTLLIDDRLGAIGTFNLDRRSFFSNFELSVILTGEEAVRSLAEEFERDLRECREFDPNADGSQASAGLKERVCRLLAPLL